MLLSAGPVIGREHLAIDKVSSSTPVGTPLAPPPRVDTQKVAAPTERDKIMTALASCAGNQSRAAEMLGIPRRTFLNKLDAYNIPRPKKKISES